MMALMSIVVAVLVGVGVYFLMVGNPFRLAVGFVLFSNGINLAVLSSIGLPGLAQLPPLLREGLPDSLYVDPLPQAFVLTAIVISLGALSFLLGVVKLMQSNTSETDRTLDKEALPHD